MPTRTLETPSADRPPSVRARPDLVVVPQRWRGKSVWAVQDPLARRYYHLSEHEWSIFQWLDGQTSLAEVRRRFEARFAPLRLGGEQLQHFLAMLAEEGLLIVDAPNQAERLSSRRERERRGRRAQALLNVLSIRLPGFNPERLLEWLYGPLAWLFSPLCVAAWVLVAAGTAVSLAVNWSDVTARLPGLAELAAPAHWFWVLATLAVIKLLHELGHALAMRHFGGRCREMGLMLLVFTPSLYSNVSDCWMLESRWRRIAVAAAGMYVELILATLATLGWWWTQEGLINTLCLSTMLICSLGTVLLNGNPLMRFDGYYILADLVEVPNLAEQAGVWLRRTAARWLLGVELPEHPALMGAPRKLLAGYALASTAYRWLLIVGVLWGLNHLLAAWKLEALGVLLTGVVLASLVLPTALAATAFVRQPQRRGRWRPGRALVSGVLLAGLAALALWLPVPMNVSAPAIVEYAGAKSVFVEVAGELSPRVEVGQKVRRGELLARLTNRDMTLELARLVGQRERQRQRLAGLEARRLSDPTQGEMIPSTRAALADLEERLKQLRQDIARLELTAPASGTVLPAPPQEQPGKDGTLPGWQGTPLAARNAGSFLRAGTLLCLVGDPIRTEALLSIDQSDIDLLAVGQRVRLQLDQLPGQTIVGTLVEIGLSPVADRVRDDDRRAAAAVATDRRAEQRRVVYTGRVRFDERSVLVARSGGQAKIAVASLPLYARLSRWLSQSLRF